MMTKISIRREQEQSHAEKTPVCGWRQRMELDGNKEHQECSTPARGEERDLNRSLPVSRRSQTCWKLDFKLQPLKCERIHFYYSKPSRDSCGLLSGAQSYRIYKTTPRTQSADLDGLGTECKKAEDFIGKGTGCKKAEGKQQVEELGNEMSLESTY